MKRKLQSGWLLLALSSAFARDPFEPVTVAGCRQSIPSLEGWRLQGTIGNGETWFGWLRAPDGKVLSAIPQQPFLFPLWQVKEAKNGQVTLSAQQSCQPQTHHLRLKGMKYEDRDNRSPDRAGIRHGRADK